MNELQKVLELIDKSENILSVCSISGIEKLYIHTLCTVLADIKMYVTQYIENNPPLKLEVGKVYETENGERWLVVKDDGSDVMPMVAVALFLTCDKSGVESLFFNKDGTIPCDTPLIKLSDNQSREIVL